MKRYGLVFKIEDQCWLAEYVDGSIEDASPIDDNDKVYEDLNPREMSLVSIASDGEVEGGERVSLQDLKTITIKCDEDPDRTIADFIESGNLPALAEEIFSGEELE